MQTDYYSDTADEKVISELKDAHYFRANLATFSIKLCVDKVSLASFLDVNDVCDSLITEFSLFLV